MYNELVSRTSTCGIGLEGETMRCECGQVYCVHADRRGIKLSLFDHEKAALRQDLADGPIVTCDVMPSR